MRLALLLFSGPLVAGAGWRIGTKCGEALFNDWIILCDVIGKRLQNKPAQP